MDSSATKDRDARIANSLSLFNYLADMKKQFVIYDTSHQPGIVAPSAVLELVSNLDASGIYLVNGAHGEKPSVHFDLIDGSVEVSFWGVTGDEPQATFRYVEKDDRWQLVR